MIPITGRPAGWCDHIARMWPVDAVVGENGAFYMRYDAAARRLVKRFVATDDERVANRARLAAIGARILREVPGWRWLPTSTTARPISRSTSARMCRRCRVPPSTASSR